ncbi:hypothetical protein RUND412_008888 [Rhizina undulata]
MNWTGGRRARHNNPASDITRLQKQYFAKVRTTLNSAIPPSSGFVEPVARDGNDDGAGRSREILTFTREQIESKKRKLVIPDFDIITAKVKVDEKCGRKHMDLQSCGLKKRKLLSPVDEEVSLLEKSRHRRTTSPSISKNALAKGKKTAPSDGSKTQKQLLLETDDWVCTSLSWPMKLRKKSTEPSAKPTPVASKVSYEGDSYLPIL